MTVVIIVLVGGDLLRRCLLALRAQTGAPELRIVVPFDDAHPDVEALQTAFPDVQFVRVPGRHTYAELRTIGVRRASSDVVALLEDHCVPDPGWAHAVVRAHESTVVSVGGPVEKFAPDSALNWSLYLADYVRYARPHPAGPVEHLTDCNVTYKKRELDAIADVWATEFHEPEVHGALRERGGVLWFDPDVLVLQQRPIALAEALRDRYSFGRLFGSRRVAGQSLISRAKMAAVAVALPPLLVLRVGKNVFDRGRYRAQFFRSLPFVVLMSTTWALGEMLGYVTGRPAASLEASPVGPARAQVELQ